MIFAPQWKTRGGGTKPEEPEEHILDLKKCATPTTQDLELAVDEQKTRILERTARGVDFEEQPFAPYSTKGPYYYYPNGRLGKVGRSKFSESQRKANLSAAKRLHAAINKGNRGTPLGQVTPGGGIKFASYAEFKQALGRTNVDLMGPRAPHMLQAIVKAVRGSLEVALGIYGDEAKRASGINSDTNRPKGMPQRKFFAVSGDDQKKISARILQMIKSRLQ